MIEPFENAGFSKSSRLLSRSDFQRVFKVRKSVANRFMVVYAAPNALPHCRIGLVVSRKVGNAVVRNRWKRQLREAFRMQQHTLPLGWDLVVLPRGGQSPASADVAKSLAELAGKAVRKVGKSVAASGKAVGKNIASNKASSIESASIESASARRGTNKNNGGRKRGRGRQK